MPTKIRVQIALTLLLAAVVTLWASQSHAHSWLQFSLFLAAILLSSGFKVALPRGDGTMSLNFPFILLGIVLLSPLQVILLTAISVAAQCRIRVVKMFTAIQILFNVANAMNSAAAALFVFQELTHLHMAVAPALSLASVAYFLCNTASVAKVMASTKNENPFLLWRAEFPWYLPFYIVGAVLAAIASWMSTEFGWATVMLLVPMVYTVYRAYTGHMARLKERQQHLEDTEALHLRTIEGLAMAIEAKDQGTHDHLFRVRSYVQEVGMELQLSKLELQALHTAAFLHDIGKLAVPEHIINKPGKLTQQEFDKMKIHPVVGADILERVRFPYPVVPIVRSHHEWWDGTGYPDGLKGDEIPIGARILTVVDCFDALVSDRPYRKGMSNEKALSIVKSMSGKQFDPTVVEVFERQHMKMQERIGQMVLPEFVALDTKVEVDRGIAPGAGFAKEDDAMASGNVDPSVAAAESLALAADANEEAQRLFEMSKLVGSSLGEHETLSMMTSRLRRFIPFDSCALYVKQGEELYARFADGDSASCFAGKHVREGEGISGWVGQSGKAIVNGNAMVEPGCAANSQLRSALSVPLFDSKRDIFGVLTLYSMTTDSFRLVHLRILQAMEAKLTSAVMNVLSHGSDDSKANTDLLAKLPDARSLFLELESKLHLREDESDDLCVVVCDLNSFRNIDAECGRFAGVTLLNFVAEELLGICGPKDVVARTGLDEFVLVIHGVTPDDVAARTRYIEAALSSAERRAGLGVRLSACLGAAFYPRDGEHAEDLLAVAGRRMRLNKETYYQSFAPIHMPQRLSAVAACGD